MIGEKMMAMFTQLQNENADLKESLRSVALNLHLEALQNEVRKWYDGLESDAQSTIPGILAHLIEEAGELEQADFIAREQQKCGSCGPETAERYLLERDKEAADVFILLLLYCSIRGIDLMKVGYAKHQINLKRTWHKDENGVIRHT